jgi:hypothetical protein
VNSDFESAFAALAVDACPRYDAMLLAIEREFRGVAVGPIAAALDDFARPLFGAAAGPAEDQAVELGRAVWAVVPHHTTDVGGWLLSPALTEGTGTGVVRAAIAVELGRRAGIDACLARYQQCWGVQVRGGGVEIGVATGSTPALPAGRATRPVCAHSMAFTVLTGLANAWLIAGELRRAQRACGLRALLPLDPETRTNVVAEARAFGDQL